jgi:leucokinin receptor
MALNKSEHFSVYNDQLIFSGNISVAASPQLYEASALIIAILAIFYGSISLVSLVGNSLVVIIIAGNKRMQSVTNFLLANLASSDILIAVAAVPFQFQAALLQRWVLPHFMCILAPFVQVSK